MSLDFSYYPCVTYVHSSSSGGSSPVEELTQEDSLSLALTQSIEYISTLTSVLAVKRRDIGMFISIISHADHHDDVYDDGSFAEDSNDNAESG